VICHEYGHILGLPDLYDTAYLRMKDAGPADDSAGIGGWGLMGWGGTGWDGHDGPNSLCAWSRARLGWANAEAVSQPRQDISLTPVGQGVTVVQIPAGNADSFVLEYRTREACYYDRAIPGEGLLVWHAQLQLGEGPEAPTHWEVDLECADGRWQDKGYPQGRIPAPLDGGDNLDFWAHDAEYRAAHVGNLGDETDPFDGAVFTSFSAETNPSALSAAGASTVRVDSIRRVDGAMAFTVTATQPVVELRNVALAEALDDGLILAGEPVDITYELISVGVIPARDVRVILSSDDPLVHIETPETSYGLLSAGGAALGGGRGGYPSFRLGADFMGAHQARLVLSVFVDGRQAIEREINATVISPSQQVGRVGVIDTLGNADGRVQPGELFGLQLSLLGADLSLLRAYPFRLLALDSHILAVTDTPVQFDQIDGRAVSIASPTFLASAGVKEGARLLFALQTGVGLTESCDTLGVFVSAGLDASAPIVRSVYAHPVAGGSRVAVFEDDIFEGSELHRAVARILDPADSLLIDEIDLELREGVLQGTWLTDGAGHYLVQAVLTDQNGNEGRSPVESFHVWGAGVVDWSDAFPEGLLWEPLGLSPRPVIFRRLLYHPRYPETVVALSQWALWQSVDGGRTWRNLGIMIHEDSQVYLDPSDPLTLYVEPRVSYSALRRTFDGGRTWDHLERPVPLFRLFSADPERSGRLYGGNSSSLMASDDFGDSWHMMWAGPAGFATVSGGSPRTIYTTERAPEDWRGMGTLHRSTDDGETWERCDLPAGAAWLCVDPSFSPGLYATNAKGIPCYSPDRGRHWEAPPRLPFWSGKTGLAVSPAQQHLLYSWNPRTGMLARSTDGGGAWQRLVLPDSVSGGAFVPHPHNPLRGYCLYAHWDRAAGRARVGVLHTENLQAWRPVPAPEMDLPAGAFAADDRGRLYIGSTFRDEQGRHQASVVRADGSGGWTRLLGCSPPNHIILTEVPVVRDLLASGSETAGLVALYSDYFGLFHDLTVATSADQGASWATHPFADTRETHAVTAEDPHGTGALYFGTSEQGVLRSVDGGQTWTGLMHGWYNYLSAFTLDGVEADVLYAAVSRDGPSEPTTDRLWLSRDAGASWEDTGPVAGGESLQYLAHHPLRPRYLYGLTPDALYVTVDGARTWDPVSSIGGAGEQRARRRLRFHPYDPDRMLVVTGPRLLATADGGFTWESLGEGMAAAPWFEDAAWDPLKPNELYAATPWGVYRLRPPEPVTAVSPAETRPTGAALSQNYPNPLNSETVIPFTLPSDSHVVLSLYDLAGQRVATVLDGMIRAGTHGVDWDGRDDDGRPLASGVYLFRLVIDGRQQQARRMVLLR